MKYNLALLFANALFALNYSLFVSVMQSEKLSIGAIYLLQTLSMVIIVSIWRVIQPHRNKIIELRDVASIALTAIFSSLGWSYATLQGMSLSSPIDAATIASMGPSLTLIFAHILGQRQLTGVRMAGIILSLVGVSILFFDRGWNLLSGDAGRGNILLLVAVTISAVNTLILKPQLERYGLSQVALYYALAAFAVSFPIFFKELSPSMFADFDLMAVVETSAMLIIGSALPLVLLFEGTERLSPLHTSLYRYVQPLVTTIVVVSRKQAQLTETNYIAMIAIVVGGVLVAKRVAQDRVA
ncbi:MAG: DMT family transporter [Rikenellaceae bacterium]